MATNEQDILTKRCSGCGEILSISEFNNDTNRKDGLQRLCRACQSKYKKQWKIDNPDKVKIARKKERQDNADYYRNYNRNYNKYWYKKHTEDEEFVLKKRKQRTDWFKNNPIKRRLARKRRKDLERGVINTLTESQWLAIKKGQKNKCPICNKLFTKDNPATMDHIIPITRGGNTTYENIQAVHHSCNAQKGNRIIPELIISWIEKPEMCIAQDQSYEYARASEASVSALR